MLQLVTQPIEVDIDETDLIAPGDAARITNQRVQGIVNLMAIGKLPTYLLPNDERQRPQKYTSKVAVLKLKQRRKATAKTKAKRTA